MTAHRLACRLCVSCLHFGLRSAVAGVRADTGSPPVVHLNFSSLFEMASQRPCMINVTTLTHIVLPKAPREYVKPRNFLLFYFFKKTKQKKPHGLGVVDCQSALYSTFPIVPVMSCTQTNKNTNYLRGAAPKQDN